MKILQGTEKLNSVEGFKKIFTGMFGGGKAKKSYQIYSDATIKGIFTLHTLRKVTHEDSEYYIYAFSPNEELSIEVLDDLKMRADAVDIGTIRYECLSYSKLELCRGSEGSLAGDNNEIANMAPEHQNAIIFPVASDVQCHQIIYANTDAKCYVYPLSNENFKKINT